MTRDEFLARLKEGGATEEWLTTNGFEVNTCDCGEPFCTGWRVEFTRLRDLVEREKAARGVTKQPCPSCGRLLDSAGNKKGDVPSPGDISICIYCGVFMEFTKEGPFRIVTMAEVETFPLNEQKALAALALELDIVRALQGKPRLGQE